MVETSNSKITLEVEVNNWSPTTKADLEARLKGQGLNAKIKNVKTDYISEDKETQILLG